MITAPITDERLKHRIVELIEDAQNNKIFFEDVFSDPTLDVGRNEFLFFIKPEITGEASANLKGILDLLFDRISGFNLRVHNVKILSASYLEKYGIIAQHYGVINKIASSAGTALSAVARAEFEECFGRPISECRVLGGIEILKEYPELNAYSLDYLWQNLENRKLAPGTYCEEIQIDDEKIYLFDGFHPRQLQHFTEPGKSIVTLTLSGDVSWADARKEFIGATLPQGAAEGSLRRTILERKEEFGLKEVSQGMNGFHLSAGPVEALIELQRYNSDFGSASGLKDVLSFSFGEALRAHFSTTEIDTILSNPDLEVNGRQISVFDLTEEMNADEAVTILRNHLK